jgi:hypothetical protein
VKLTGEGTQVTTNVSDEYTVFISRVDSLHGVIIHERQFMYKIIMRCMHITIVAVEKQ